MINFVDRFHEVEEKSSLYQGEGLIIMTSKRRGGGQGWGGGHDAAILSMPYLKVLLIVWSHKTFKLIFLKQPSWPKNRISMGTYPVHLSLFFYTSRATILWNTCEKLLT